MMTTAPRHGDDDGSKARGGGTTRDGALLRQWPPSAQFPFSDDLLWLNGDGSKVQGLDLGMTGLEIWDRCFFLMFEN
jgi:hypothetical protein